MQRANTNAAARSAVTWGPHPMTRARGCVLRPACRSRGAIHFRTNFVVRFKKSVFAKLKLFVRMSAAAKTSDI